MSAQKTPRWKMAICILAVVVGAAATVFPASADPIIWDTGAPHALTPVGGGDPNYVGYTSGNVSPASAQRWAAIPFRVTAPDTGIFDVAVDYFLLDPIPPDVNYIIWNRSGLNAPTTQFAAGRLGSAYVGADDPRVPGVDDWYHFYHLSTPIPIPPGDYYFTIHGGPNQGDLIYWLTGGDLQDEALEPHDGLGNGFMYRSATFPSPGFVPYYISSGWQPGPGMTDPDDMNNASFALFIPEPTTACLMGIGLVALAWAAWRRRK